ncbi:hypothetical protein ACVIGB_003966 [Bradyrhizobium sp. USDA 4341]
MDFTLESQIPMFPQRKPSLVAMTTWSRYTPGIDRPYINDGGLVRVLAKWREPFRAITFTVSADGNTARYSRGGSQIFGFSYARIAEGWSLIDEGAQRTMPPSGNVQVSDGDALWTLAIKGVGPVRLASFIVRDDIAANRLVPVLEEFNPGDIDQLHAVFLSWAGWALADPDPRLPGVSRPADQNRRGSALDSVDDYHASLQKIETRAS